MEMNQYERGIANGEHSPNLPFTHKMHTPAGEADSLKIGKLRQTAIFANQLNILRMMGKGLACRPPCYTGAGPVLRHKPAALI